MCSFGGGTGAAGGTPRAELAKEAQTARVWVTAHLKTQYHRVIQISVPHDNWSKRATDKTSFQLQLTPYPLIVSLPHRKIGIHSTLFMSGPK